MDSLEPLWKIEDELLALESAEACPDEGPSALQSAHRSISGQGSGESGPRGGRIHVAREPRAKYQPETNRSRHPGHRPWWRDLITARRQEQSRASTNSHHVSARPYGGCTRTVYSPHAMRGPAAFSNRFDLRRGVEADDAPF
jgi:hypothetical protein